MDIRQAEVAVSGPTAAKQVPVDGIGSGEGRLINHDGERLAISKAADRSITAYSAICTRLECNDGRNPVDQTWSCSCHGCGFGQQDVVLSGPVTRPLEARVPAQAGL
ncbi:Rieske 2Fe-2S domain-containing protein [Mesorhizobium sp. B2-4-2]|uniref:Rieske 2Fe-2S domain-containing protein n=1 Tax=Mesorhizobium sp. B2-4-2 TaxID=2589947 RepID=UPI00112B38AD|nr:Rieske 2Fe-2S domain-containing protein [Mesorhizobium sp. B2-4-2]TPL46252.1 Rieske 2Fe-2S domain-containing protein [Mesorhizobium sp. B2-4-2]